MREEVRKEFQDFTLVVSYSDTNSSDVHRYTIRCYHTTRWVTVFQDSNVIDKTAYLHIDDAANRVRAFYKQVFGIDILIEKA